jgi:hypothetical protein
VKSLQRDGFLHVAMARAGSPVRSHVSAMNRSALERSAREENYRCALVMQLLDWQCARD